MTTARRNGFKWTVNEILTLQRDYELLELTIQQIAAKHERTVEAILYKLYSEAMIADWHVARGYDEYADSFQQTNSCVQDQDLVNPSINALETDDYDCYDNYDYQHYSFLNEKVINMESSINDIKYMLASFINEKTNKTKRAQLRKKSSVDNYI